MYLYFYQFKQRLCCLLSFIELIRKVTNLKILAVALGSALLKKTRELVGIAARAERL